MEFLRPDHWDQALAAKAERPDAVPIVGGTDVMVELNFARRRPDVLLDLGLLPGLNGWGEVDGRLRLGAGVTYTQLTGERDAPNATPNGGPNATPNGGPGGGGAPGGGSGLAWRLPGLAMAARTVGSPQIRNRGTIGGNLGSASPAGDCHPPLLAASGAQVEVASVRGIRLIDLGDFFTGVKQNALAPDELIAAIWIDRPDGPEQFAKIGTRNAMVIAVVAFALALHPDRRTVGTGIGSAAPTPIRADDAERFLASALDEHGLWESGDRLPDQITAEFGARVAAAARPIDDVRGTAAYRRDALAVLARRTLTWAWQDYCQAAPERG